MRKLMSSSPKPVTKKIGPRRVKTEPVTGQVSEPKPERIERTQDSNKDRLKAEKPPHY